MCGISGFADGKKELGLANLNVFNKVQHHRGPDNAGVVFIDSPEANIGLAHTRLSVLDLSEAGNQPVQFKHLTLVYNGEIYNYNEIKHDLSELGYTFLSKSDSEVLLKAFDAWGMKCVDHFIGMFAFAIYDRNEDKLFLCRDRAGIKPLYYRVSDRKIIFGSELKVFFSLPDFEMTIASEYLAEFLKFGFVSDDNTLIQHIKKVEPGTWLEYNLKTTENRKYVYWDVTDFYRLPKFSGSYDDAVEEAALLIHGACNYTMISDVPVGLFLSGGFDSSLVAAVLQNDRSQRLKTFTIGFPDGKDESKDAERISKYLGTEHTSYHCTVQDARDLIPLLPGYYDEPNGDISCIPTMLVSRLAKRDVDVVISADGGDELFAGYNGYKDNRTLLRKLDAMPGKPFLRILADYTKDLFEYGRPDIAKGVNMISQVYRYQGSQKVAALWDVKSGAPDFIINKIMGLKGVLYVEPEIYTDLVNDDETLLILDFKRSLPNMLLPKVDRATAAFSLEGRAPLLDHRLVEFAARLPFDFKHNGTISKRIIKDVTYKYIPGELMDRPKTGFDLPIFKWLKSDLKYIIEEYLGEEAIKQSGCFNYNEIRKIVNAFYKDQLRYKNLLWHLITFQMWYLYWTSK